LALHTQAVVVAAHTLATMRLAVELVALEVVELAVLTMVELEKVAMLELLTLVAVVVVAQGIAPPWLVELEVLALLLFAMLAHKKGLVGL
jgi:hypothetical protein